jgi:hypothetical protein
MRAIRSLLCGAVAAGVFVVASMVSPVVAAGPTRMVVRPVRVGPGMNANILLGPSIGRRLAPVVSPHRLGPATATITVTYHNFSDAAKDAFQAAVDIWESMIVSPMTIHVDATWGPLAKGIGGQARPSQYYTIDGHTYPTALAEAICRTINGPGVDCNLGADDIIATFSSSYPDWYFGTNGNVPANKTDFESVVLHELGHGLGFAGSYYVSGLLGYVKYAPPTGYDDHVWNAATAGHPLDDPAVPSGGSTAVKQALTSGNLWFGGPAARVAVSGRARLYAPSTWQQGSSLSHLDEATYAPGTANALMTPTLGLGEAIHVVSALTMAVLYDSGWDFSAPLLFGGVGPSGGTRITTDPSAVKWAWLPVGDPSGVPDKPYLVQLQALAADNGTCAAWVNSDWTPQSALSFKPPTVTNGRCYRLRLKTTDLAGNVSDPYVGATYLVDQSKPTATVALSENAQTLSVDGSRLWMSTPVTGTTFTATYMTRDFSGVVGFSCGSAAGFSVTKTQLFRVFRCTYTAIGLGVAASTVRALMIDRAALIGSTDSFTTAQDLVAPTATVTLSSTSGGITILLGSNVAVGYPLAGATFNGVYTVKESGSGMDHLTCPTVPGFTVARTGGGLSWTCTWTATGSGYDSSTATASLVDKVGNKGSTGFAVIHHAAP